MREKLWRFTDNFGSFESGLADKIRTLYFPLANEQLMSSVSPDLHGDIKSGQNTFLLSPVSRIDLVNQKGSRNFWVYINEDKVWSATGVSKDWQVKGDSFKLEAGLLWHKVTRENKRIGLRAEILSFIPAERGAVEIMQVRLTNVSSKKIKFIPTAAIPIYARSANNLRDHRHVTSLLQRIRLHKFGVIVKPILNFDEVRHSPNKAQYFILGWDERFAPPRYIYPAQESFCGEAGDLEAPQSVYKNMPPAKEQFQGREAMGALRFAPAVLAPGESRGYIILMGIVEDGAGIKDIICNFRGAKRVENSFERTKNFWITASQQTSLLTGKPDFDNWFRWVSIQPILRRIFGCSFLPDFDYGKGGRGWRDLWQDCLSLILNDPLKARGLLINNFSGVRIDGSNATIIGKNRGEFISERNNISRVWMDHGAWPLFTLDLYLNETGDFAILSEEIAYFRNHELCRSGAIDYRWTPACGQQLKDLSGKIYKGSVLEHLLIENLVQFFNVGSHNHVRLEDADWNDGLDMASESGESIAFSAMYAHNLGLLASLLLKTGKTKIRIAKELKILLARINYADIKAKQKILQEYFTKTKFAVSGEKVDIDSARLAADLRSKSEWMAGHIRKKEWQKEGFFNGYYDNKGARVEGKRKNLVRMILSSQVFAVLSGVASDWQVGRILKSADRYLLDKKLKGLHLNTDFKKEQRHLGRAFSFIYGDKENGALFNHMSVMFAFGLYKRGRVDSAWRFLDSIYKLAVDTVKSRIYPCIPEYFNLEGRGMYSYLTGSASWFALTIITQSFGVRGQYGDLLIEPKLCRQQFEGAATITINRSFAARHLQVSISNPKKLNWPEYKIVKAGLNGHDLPVRGARSILIERGKFLRLALPKLNRLNIILG